MTNTIDRTELIERTEREAAAALRAAAADGTERQHHEARERWVKAAYQWYFRMPADHPSRAWVKRNLHRALLANADYYCKRMAEYRAISMDESVDVGTRNWASDDEYRCWCAEGRARRAAKDFA